MGHKLLVLAYGSQSASRILKSCARLLTKLFSKTECFKKYFFSLTGGDRLRGIKHGRSRSEEAEASPVSVMRTVIYGENLPNTREGEPNKTAVESPKDMLAI